MKIFLLFFCFFISFKAHSLVYQFDKGDDLGGVLISFGYKQLWTGEKAINKFKNRIKTRKLSSIQTGRLFNIELEEIKFKKNISISENNVFLIRKIKTIKEWEEINQNEMSNVTPTDLMSQKEPTPPAKDLEVLVPEVLETKEIEVTNDSTLKLFGGGGIFLANDSEIDRNVKTSTYTGIQPMLDFKLIYSHSQLGSVASELMLKKILNSGYQFPLNYDFRFQVLPQYFQLNNFQFAVSYSTNTHSYIGKPSVREIEYELNSHFFGLGMIYQNRDFWVELYIEKAMSGQTKSSEKSLTIDQGMRLDAEVIYPINDKWSLIPGLNYSQYKGANYQINVIETRLNITREFEWSF